MKPVYLLLISTFIISLLQAQPPVSDLNLDLIGHYLLDGSDADSSGQKNHCLALGTYTTDRHGNPKSALRLSQDGHYILFPPIITLSDPEWTYSLWLRADTLAAEASDMFLLSLSDVEEWQDIHLFIDNTGNDFKTWYESAFWKSSAEVVPKIGEWYHVAISSAADDTIRIYVNGEKKLSQSIDFISEGEESFMFSSLINFPEDPLKGRFFGVVDDIRIYGRAITDEEIATIHDPLWDFVPEPVVPEFVSLNTSLLTLSQPLRFSTNAHVTRVSMYDVQGREVIRARPTPGEELIIMPPALASGMYIVHAYTPNNLFRGKVMIIR